MPLRPRLPLLLVLSASAVTRPALGNPPPPPAAPPASPAPTVADHTTRGDRARWAGRWTEAAHAYQAALKATEAAALPATQRAPLLGELGLAELALGRHRDAAEHLHLALQHPGALTPAQRRRFEQGQKKAEREVGMLFISVDPPDAEVLVDGQPLGARRLSYLIFVNPGTHVVRARLEGHADAFASIDAPHGSWPSVSLRLSKAPSTPDQRVAAPGTPAPVPAPPAPPARAGAAASLRAAGFIVTGAGAALGAALAIAGVAVDDQVENRATALQGRAGLSACLNVAYDHECLHLRGLVTTRDTLDSAAVASFIASGVIGVVTVSSLWWAPGERSSAPVRVVPAATDKQAGALLTGAW